MFPLLQDTTSVQTVVGQAVLRPIRTGSRPVRTDSAETNQDREC